MCMLRCERSDPWPHRADGNSDRCTVGDRTGTEVETATSTATDSEDRETETETGEGSRERERRGEGGERRGKDDRQGD
eukprot:827903-Rhodomonas_salina.1